MFDHVKPTISNDTPDHVIVHSGPNDLPSEKKASQINKLKDNDNSDIVSAIVPTKVNNRLLLMFKERNIPFISHRKKILIRVNISVRVSYN